ncbi:hypothetical protein V9T40_011476 [Parthenolecanium corni]|uniref:NAD-dependent protein deacylase n=1 Tax=Parthenolecanium corni TaxID=536013 RepID=A0AAN9XZL1_9HEMI
MDKFKKILNQSKNILILTGAGVSAESDIPTFRGSGGFWRKYQAQMLATPQAFKKSPSLVWEFYHYRRELVLTKSPNKAHVAIADFEKQCENENRKFTLITQNIDGLHAAAGSKNIIELHGSLFETRCLSCGEIRINRDSPICASLSGRGAPDIDERSVKDIPVEELPRCKNEQCGGLLRPNVVWFGEGLDPNVLSKTEEVLENCDVCLVIGTSSVVYPAAAFAPRLVKKGVPVAEFNLETTPCTSNFQFHFDGPCSQTIPEALALCP